MEKNHGYALLAGAIINDVKNEYIEALLMDDRAAAYACERWFLSDWAQLLSLHHGEEIIEHARKAALRGSLPVGKICRLVRRKFNLDKYSVKQIKKDCAALEIELNPQTSGGYIEYYFPTASWKTLCDFVKQNIQNYIDNRTKDMVK